MRKTLGMDWMPRQEYFETLTGQLALRERRQRTRLWFRIKQQPKSKGSLSNDEKVLFQKEILQTLVRRKRRAFHSPLIMEIDFYSAQPNPPHVHTLAKAYLDLLENPVKGLKTRREKLVYANDSQIKFLIVNYHLEQRDEPEISVTVDALRNFMDDIRFYHNLKHGHFRIEERSYRNFPLNIDEGNNNESRDLHALFESLEDIEATKEQQIAQFGQSFYEMRKDMVLKDIQRDYLRSGDMKTDTMLGLLDYYANVTEKPHIYEQLEDFWKSIRENIILTVQLGMDLSHAPFIDGQTSIFKNKVKEAVSEFKSRYPILFPLRYPVSATIFYIPPKPSNRDLDNLARNIIPFIHDILLPPANYLESINIDVIDNPEIRQRYLDSKRARSRLPKHSVTSFQVIELPRFEDDPYEGSVHLVLGDGFFPRSIWHKLDDRIRKWLEGIR